MNRVHDFCPKCGEKSARLYFVPSPWNLVTGMEFRAECLNCNLSVNSMVSFEVLHSILRSLVSEVPGLSAADRRLLRSPLTRRLKAFEAIKNARLAELVDRLFPRQFHGAKFAYVDVVLDNADLFSQDQGPYKGRTAVTVEHRGDLTPEFRQWLRVTKYIAERRMIVPLIEAMFNTSGDLVSEEVYCRFADISVGQPLAR